MKILVAGGAGFIGSHLIDRLLAHGHEVICADKLIFGDHAIAHLLSDKLLIQSQRFSFVKADLSVQSEVDQIFSAHKIDAVYHLAANSDIQKGGQEPNIDFRDTLMTTHCLLEGMRTHQVKKLFFASSSAAYGDKTETLLTEETGDMRPVSYYGGCKFASEALISSYTAMCSLNTVIFRFPNVIGPRLTHGVIFDFIKKLKANPDELEILGNGTQCKPYIYVFDLIEAIYQRTANWEDGEHIYNVGVLSAGTTVTKIAEIVTEVMGLSQTTFKYTGGNIGWKGDVPKYQFDIRKILATGWQPEYSSDEAVLLTAKAALQTQN